MKRKNIAVCTAVILTLSLLAGCGKNAETNGSGTGGQQRRRSCNT